MTRTSPGHDANARSGTRLAEEAAQWEPAAGDLLRMDVRADPEGPITLRVIGEVDLATAPLLRSRAMEHLGQAPGRLVLDLRGVEFLGSSGLAVLIEIRSEALRRGIGLQLVTASRAVLRPLIATGLIELFDVEAGDW
ncbi:MAG: STAS domain-containing protein [Pseudonocardiaceae bacterium]